MPPNLLSGGIIKRELRISASSLAIGRVPSIMHLVELARLWQETGSAMVERLQFLNVPFIERNYSIADINMIKVLIVLKAYPRKAVSCLQM